jgi:transposase
MEAAGAAVCLVMRAVLLSARWAGWRRRLCLAGALGSAGELAHRRAENLLLRDRLEQQAEQIAHLRRRLRQANVRLPYSPAECLRILWCVEYFGIPRRRIPECFGVARSTVWRWLRRLQEGVGLCGRKCQVCASRTPERLVRLVWEIAAANGQWGRRRIALVLETLGVFLAASTVRNILVRSRPRERGGEAVAGVEDAQRTPRQIVARYPNHVWSVECAR